MMTLVFGLGSTIIQYDLTSLITVAQILFPDKLTSGGSRGRELWEDAVEPGTPP